MKKKLIWVVGFILPIKPEVLQRGWINPTTQRLTVSVENIHILQ